MYASAAGESGDLMNLLFIVVLIICIAVLGFRGPAWLRKWSSKKYVEKLEPIAAALGGEIISDLWFESYLILRVDKYEARVELPQRKSQESPLILRLMTTLPFTLSVSPEDSANLEVFLGDTAAKFLRNLESKYEFQIGDQAFDDKYFLVSENPNLAKEFLLSGQKREIVDYFFKNGFTSLGATKYSVYAAKSGYGPDDFEPWTVRYHLGQLNKFASA